MNVYQALNLVEIKDGRLYFFNVPQLGQSFTEVQEMLDAFKKQVQELEENSKKTKPADSTKAGEPTVVMDSNKEAPKEESVTPTGESEA